MITMRPPRALRPPGLAAEGDGQLARRVSRGDDRAFEILFGRYRDPLSRYCRAVLRHEQDAEDAFQQTMIRAYRALGRGDGAVNLRPWLFRIAHNECVRVVGGRRPHDALSGGETSAPSEGPAERAETREELAQLRTDLLALPTPQRSALVLRELSGLSHRQIAETLGATPETAKQLIHEARVSLGEYSAGRSLACGDVRRRISDGDGRVLRARAVSSHLRGCEGCRDFRAGIARRPRQLAALFPALPGLLAERGAAALITGGAGAAGAGGLGGASLVGGIGAAGAALVASAALLVSSGALAPAAEGTRAVPERPAAAAVAAPAPTAATAAATGVRAPRVRTGATAAPAATVAPAAAPAGGGAGTTPAAPASPAPAGAAPTGGGGAPGGGTAPASPAAGGTAAAPAVSAGATLPGVQAGATAGAQGVQAGATVAVPPVVPGTSATATVGATTGTGGTTARVGVDVRTPVAPPVTADVGVSVTPDDGVAVAVTPPVLPLPVPSVTVQVPPVALPPVVGGGGLLP